MKQRFLIIREQISRTAYEFEADVDAAAAMTVEDQAVEQFAALDAEARNRLSHNNLVATTKVQTTTREGAATRDATSYNHRLYVPRDEAEELQAACDHGLEDCGKDEKLFDREVVFSDGKRMAIQVCAEQDKPAWTQGVLYSPEGTELGFTPAGDTLLGEYTVFYGDVEYTVLVEIEHANPVQS